MIQIQYGMTEMSRGIPVHIPGPSPADHNRQLETVTASSDSQIWSGHPLYDGRI